MTKNEALDKVEEYLTSFLPIEEVEEILEALKQGPRWIPISEELPKAGESVRVCYKSQGGIVQTVSERFVYVDGSTVWSGLCGAEPIAWMPLTPLYEISITSL